MERGWKLNGEVPRLKDLCSREWYLALFFHGSRMKESVEEKRRKEQTCTQRWSFLGDKPPAPPKSSPVALARKAEATDHV